MTRRPRNKKSADRAFEATRTYERYTRLAERAVKWMTLQDGGQEPWDDASFTSSFVQQSTRFLEAYARNKRIFDDPAGHGVPPYKSVVEYVKALQHYYTTEGQPGKQRDFGSKEKVDPVVSSPFRGDFFDETSETGVTKLPEPTAPKPDHPFFPY